MKKTIKKIISITLAIAMIVSSLTYYHSTDIKADTDPSTLEYTTVTAGDNTIGYCVESQNIAGWAAPWYGDGGITFQIVYSADNLAENTTVKINGVETPEGGVVNQIGTGLLKLNPTLMDNNAYTKVEITTTTGSAILYIKKGNPSGGTTTTVAPSVTAEPGDEWITSLNQWLHRKSDGSFEAVEGDAADYNAVQGITAVWSGNGAEVEVSNNTDNMYELPVNVISTAAGAWSTQVHINKEGLDRTKVYDVILKAGDDVIYQDEAVSVNNFRKTVDLAGKLSVGETTLTLTVEEAEEPSETPSVENIVITPNTAQITANHTIYASWTNPTKTGRAYAYLESVADGKGVIAANGWDFNTQAGQPMTGIDSVSHTKDDSVTVEEGLTYTLIVESFDAWGRKNGHGEVEITIPGLTPEEREVQEYLAKINTDENLALNKTPIVAEGNNENTANNIVDGNNGSRWQANKNIDNTYFGVDLGEEYNIDKVLVSWEASNARAYEIYTAGNDGVYSQTPVATVSGLDNNKSVVKLSKNISTTARYVKVVVTEWSGNAEAYGISPFELAVFEGDSTGQKHAPSGFTVAYTDDLGNIVFNWTASQDYTTANLYVDDNLYAGGPITNGQVINVEAFIHAEHTYKIEGITDDTYGVTERTAGVTLGMVPQKAAPADFTAEFADDYANVVFDWDADSPITSAKLYIDGDLYEDSPISRGTKISRTDIGLGNHDFSIVGITSDIYRETMPSAIVPLNAFIYTTSTEGHLSPDSIDGIGNNYCRFHDKGATASSTAGEYNASNAIDNAANTRWASSDGIDPSYITVDLQQVRPIKQIELYWEAANAKNFQIQISNNGTDFTTIASKTNANSGNRYDTFYLIDEAQARYVRIYGTERNLNYGYSLYDIGIFGSDSDSYIDPVPSNLTVTHTYGLEAKDDYLTINFECGYGSDATYNVYADFADDGVTGFTLLGNVPASGSRIYGTDSFKIANRPGANRNNQIKITSVYNGVESDYSNTYTLHYERETLSSTALGTFTPSYQAVGDIAAFPSTKNDGALHDYTDYAYSRAHSSSGTATNTIDNKADTQLGSSASDPQWVEVDLREEYQIKEFDLLWNEAKASDYYIQVSTDGENYTNAYIVRNALVKDSEDGTKNQRVDNIVLNQMVTARYVRFYGTARDITNQYEHNIREFAIYGPEADKSGPDMTDNHEYTPIPTSDDPAVIDNLDWTKLGNLSSNGATAYMRTSDYNTIVSDFARYCLAGTDIDGAGIRTYHLVNGTDHMYDNNYLTMGIKNGLKFAQIEEISINDLTYIVPRDSENEKVYIKSNCLYFDESVIGAEPGEINYYVVDLGAKSEIAPFLIKVVGADIFTYTIGGDGETPVTYSDAPGDNVYDYTGQGGYGFSFAQVNNGFYKTKTIGNNTYANYLRYKNVSVTGTSNKQSADGAIDSTDNIYGNAGSRWESDWVSPYSDGEGITIDLGAVYDVSAFDILWERANAKNYNIQVSEDGETWKEVFKATKLNANYVSQDTTLSDRVDSIKLLSDTKARYVKITGTTKNLTNVGEYGYSIWDVAVYGPTSPSYVDNVYAEYLRDEVVYTRWEEVFGADNYVTTLYDSNGDVIAATTKGSAELASVIDAKNLKEGTYTVKVESYKGNTKLGEGTKTFTVDRPQSTDIIHENAGVGTYQGGTDQSGATLSYEVQIKEVHGAKVASDLGLNIAYLTDGSTDVLNVAYNYSLNNVKQAVAFVNGKQMTAEDGVLNWEDQLLKINESKIPENSITKYDIYLTIAHVQIVVNKGETAKSQKAEIFENPVDLTVQTGNDYTFSGSAGGSNVTYQWQYQDLLGEWTDIEGATTASVSGVAKMAINGRKFRFIAQAHDNNGKNYGSPVTSQAATLTVTPRQVTGLELNNDAGEVIAQWPAVAEATGYTLEYTYNNNTITIDNISAETTSYDFTVAYAADSSKGYPDNGSIVYVTPIVTGQEPTEMTATALADIYVESVSVNNGAALVAGDTYDSVLVMKNRGTAWVDISTSNFTATASTTDWNPTVTGTTKSMFLPDMVDTCSITYTGFTPATAGTYNINYEVNTKLQAAQEQQVHVITESNYANNTKATSVTVLAEEPVIKVDSSKASVQGFQIRTNQGEDFDGRFDGSVAFRTVCKAPSIGTKFTARDGREYTVASIGIIYSIDENKTGDNSKMTIGPANTILNPQEVTPEKEAEKGYKYEGKGNNELITKGYVATPSAVLGSSGGYTTYAITMQGMDTQMANSMLVRSFIVATDGTFIYSTKVARVSVAEIADYMYYNSLCNNDNGHKYLYDTILNSSYTATSKYHRTQELEYGWNSTIYDKLPD